MAFFPFPDFGASERGKAVLGAEHSTGTSIGQVVLA